MKKKEKEMQNGKYQLFLRFVKMEIFIDVPAGWANNERQNKCVSSKENCPLVGVWLEILKMYSLIRILSSVYVKHKLNKITL